MSTTTARRCISPRRSVRPDESPIDYVDAVCPDVPDPEDCEPATAAARRFALHRSQLPPADRLATDVVVGSRDVDVATGRDQLLDAPDQGTALPDGTIDPISHADPGRHVGPGGRAAHRAESVLRAHARVERALLCHHDIALGVAARRVAAGGQRLRERARVLWDEDRRLLGFATQRALMRAVAPGERLGPK